MIEILAYVTVTKKLSHVIVFKQQSNCLLSEQVHSL